MAQVVEDGIIQSISWPSDFDLGVQITSVPTTGCPFCSTNLPRSSPSVDCRDQSFKHNRGLMISWHPCEQSENVARNSWLSISSWYVLNPS